jgi:hypothetical protein
LNTFASHQAVVPKRVMFGKVVGWVEFSWGPEEIELALVDAILHPPTAHVERFGEFLAHPGVEDSMGGVVPGVVAAHADVAGSSFGCGCASEPRKAQQTFFMRDALVHNFACSVSTGHATLSQTSNVLTPRTSVTFLKQKMLEFGLQSLFVNATLTQRCNCI